MPAPSIKALAKKAGKSDKEAEKLWKKAVKIAEEEKGKKEDDFSDKDFAYTMGVFKNMLGIKESQIKESLDDQDKRYWSRRMDDSTYQNIKGIDTYYIMFDDNSDLAIFSKGNIITDTTSTDGSAKKFLSLINGEDLLWLKSISRIRENKMKEAFKKGDKVTSNKGKGVVIGNEGTAPPMVKVKMDSGEELVFRARELKMNESIKSNEKVSFLESNMDAKEWLETQFPPEGSIEETMTSGPISATELPENPVPVGKKKIEDDNIVEEEKDDRDLVVDDRDPLDK